MDERARCAGWRRMHAERKRRGLPETLPALQRQAYGNKPALSRGPLQSNIDYKEKEESL